MTSGIEGLAYFPDYMTPAEQEALLSDIDAQSWRSDLKRRTQHYGYVYDYRTRSASDATFLGALPDWISPLATKLGLEFFQNTPDQAIVNEYEPGQGIASHVDCIPCFGETIVSLSLGSGVIMEFRKGEERHDLWLEPGSLLVLCAEARYAWKHGIAKRKTDRKDGVLHRRCRRVSVTFRTMKQEEE